MATTSDSDDVRKLLGLFPESARPLLVATGPELVERIGLDAVREVILDVLSGVNLRDSTEMLTRRRIAFLNAAMIKTFTDANRTIGNFDARLPSLAVEGLSGRLSKADRWILLWLLGLTEKAMQNVLRDKSETLANYAVNYQEAILETMERARADWGDLSVEIKNAGHSTSLNWTTLLHLSTALGSQTLAIRGSEKSLYGKLFERLILGSLLHVLGFRMISQDELTSNDQQVFWLASQGERRESDATLLYRAGLGVRFDIGFIGRGNSEISLDKVSRFEREVDFGRKTWYLATYIVVDTIPKTSRLPELAANIEGSIFQMSMGYWPKVVAQALHGTLGYKSPLLAVADRDIRAYLTECLSDAPLHRILEIAAEEEGPPSM